MVFIGTYLLDGGFLIDLGLIGQELIDSDIIKRWSWDKFFSFHKIKSIRNVRNYRIGIRNEEIVSKKYLNITLSILFYWINIGLFFIGKIRNWNFLSIEKKIIQLQLNNLLGLKALSLIVTSLTALCFLPDLPLFTSGSRWNALSSTYHLRLILRFSTSVQYWWMSRSLNTLFCSFSSMMFRGPFSTCLSRVTFLGWSLFSVSRKWSCWLKRFLSGLKTSRWLGKWRVTWARSMQAKRLSMLFRVASCFGIWTWTKSYKLLLYLKILQWVQRSKWRQWIPWQWPAIQQKEWTWQGYAYPHSF